MPGLPAILRIIFSIFAGIGGLEVADRLLPGKMKGYQPVSPGLKLGSKLAVFVGAMGVGALAWNFINRKFHILTPRHSPRRRKGRRRK